MAEEKEYKKYVKKDLWKEFEKHCKANCLDFYSCGCILTAHLVMEKLMQHTPEEGSHGSVSMEKVTPAEAWKSAMDQTDYHSGFSASCTASIISQFSPRGDEFKQWWKAEYE